MDREEVLARRLQTQWLVGPPADSVEQVVDRLTCVQSQEHAHALWSLSLRLGSVPEGSAAALAAAYDRGDFLRTHVLRPTWHFVAPQDLDWVMRLTAARVHQRNGPVYRRNGLDDDRFRATTKIMIDAVDAHGPRTRPQLAAALERAGYPATGDHLAHVVMHAELERELVSGPMAGAQHTYVRFADRVPDDVGSARDPDDPEAELAWRFFHGHGPAGIDDLVRWSSQTKTAVRAAVGRLGDRLGDRLATVTVDDHQLWYDPALPFDPALHQGRQAWLVPLYDELTLSYPKINFPVVDGHPHRPGADLFVGSVLLDRRNVGLWKRTVTGRTVAVETQLAPGLGRAERVAVEEAVGRLVAHLGLSRTT